MRIRLRMLGLICTLLFAPSLYGQYAPICDVTCKPNPSSPNYAGTFAARSTPNNMRGQSSVLGTVAKGAPKGRLPLVGSQSYSYAVPILHLPGRNGLDVNLTLYYNSRVWIHDLANNTMTFNADQDFPTYGFRLGYGFIEGSNADVTGNLGYVLTEGDGTKRDLTTIDGSTYQSLDSSYIDWYPSSLTLKRKDGSQWFYQQVGTSKIYRPIKIEDTNGNYISISYSTASNVGNLAISTIIDTLGRQITFNYDSNGRLTSITAPAYNSGTYTVTTFSWTTIALNYHFSVSVKDSPSNGSNINVLTAVQYASGAGYTFSYGGWGIVNQITRISSNGTTRSYVSYNFPSSSTSLSDAPAYTLETVNDGIQTASWTYSTTYSGSLVDHMAITAPNGTVSTTYLWAVSGQWNIGLMNYSTVTSPSGTLLRKTAIQWGTDSQTVSYPLNPCPINVFSWLSDTNQESLVSYSYTTYKNVSQVKEYDYGPVLARTTNTTYLTTSSYITQHILDRPTQVQVYNANGNLIARNDFSYDENSPLPISGASQHDDTNYGSAFNIRGNLTSVARYANAAGGSGAVTRQFTYDTLGNLLTAAVDCCQSESWSFVSGTQYAYPDSMTRGTGPQFSSSWTYDFNTGLTASATDENQKTTSFTYDVMKRVTRVTRPDSVNINYAYNDSDAQPNVQATVPINSSYSVVQTTTLDGLGRTIKQQSASAGNSITSIVDTQYNTIGRVSQVSNPHSTSEQQVWTTYSYDNLGRPTTVTPPGSAGSYQYSYQGNATTVTDPGAKQRKTFMDAMGRLAQVYEPGYDDGSAGTGSVTFTGAQAWILITNPNPPPAHIQLLDSGYASVTIGSYTATYPYGLDGQPDDPSSIAAGLAYTLNNDGNSPVTATAAGGTLTLISKVPGPQSNYSLSASVATYDSSDFPNGSFHSSPSGSTLTGGTDGSGANGHSPSLSTPLVTVYNYDASDNLVSLFQGQQQRTFVYDGLSRLTSATTPEAGTINYTYNSYSLVSSRTDARQVTTNYTYDGLNRLKTITYSEPQGVTVPLPHEVDLGYDSGGASANANDRRTSMTDGVGSETYTYDVLGRVTNLAKTIGATYSTGYLYNYISGLTQINYPSGRQVQQSFDAIGRLSQIQSGGINYLSNIAYNSAFEPTSLSYGNGVAGSFTYNSQLQLASLAYTKGSTLFSSTYNYGTGDNGQIQSITDNVDSGRTVNYTYDAWSRLKTAATNGSTNYPAWGLSWSYDRYGNRKSQTVTAGTGPSNSLTFAYPGGAQTNHPDGYAFDLAGNMTNDGINTLAYDAENRVVTSTANGVSTTYTYDGTGLRVQKQVGNATPTVYVFSGTKVIAEYNLGAAPTSPNKEYIYGGSSLLATISASTTTYHHPDHLSIRLDTDSSGNVLGQQGHYPFGESWYATGTTTKWQFTGYERDSESANDYATARSYVNRFGRFSSPDPLAGTLANPQSLNRYSYVQSDPINAVDPLGSTLVCLLDQMGNCAQVFSFGGGNPFEAEEYRHEEIITFGYDPEFPNKNGMKDRFDMCLNEYGDKNAKANLTLEGYLEAQKAAGDAGISTADVLALWDNENSLRMDTTIGGRDVWLPGPHGEIGPIQLRLAASLDLGRLLPDGWNHNALANLTAGARYYARLINHSQIPESQAAAAYNAGQRGYRRGKRAAAGAQYQKAFDEHRADHARLDECMRTGK
jgi:RHS repeat-associated protein